MKAWVIVLVCGTWLAACERSKSSEPAPVVAPRPIEAAAADAAVTESAAQLAVEVRAAMTELAAYSESIVTIVRDHGKDCDAAAKLLAERAPVFEALGSRMMALKEKMEALTPEERDLIKRESEQMLEPFVKRNPDLDAIEQRAKACEKSSPAFAAIAPKVAFKKKK